MCSGNPTPLQGLWGQLVQRRPEGAVTACPTLPPGYDAKLKGCSSHLGHFSSLWTNSSDSAGRSVCVYGEAYSKPGSSPGRWRSSSWGSQSALLCKGCFMFSFLSWTAIWSVLLQIYLLQTAPSHLFQVLELWKAGWAPERCKSFPCTHPCAQRCSNVPICPPTAHAKPRLC